MSSSDGLNKIIQSGNSSILTYDDIQTRTLDSIRIGNYCGKFLNLYNNVFIGYRAGEIATNVENSILIGHNAGDNINNGNNVIIVGYNYNSNSCNSISIGDNYSSTLTTSIGKNNYNYGISNVIIGYNSSNYGTNLFSIGNNIEIKAVNVYYHNGFFDPVLSNITVNPILNLFYDNYSKVYSNTFNTITNTPNFISTIQFQKKNLISDFINPILKKDCIIIQGDHYVLYNNISSSNIQFPDNININQNQLYNLTNYSSNSIVIPLSIIKRIAIPRLNILSKTVYFNKEDGYVLNENEYQLQFIISTPPLYGNFKNNIINKIEFNDDNLIYISNNLFNSLTDKCGITPYIIINNEYIKGPEEIFNFQRTFINYNLNSNLPISINFSKDILLNSNIINIDVLPFDFTYIESYIIQNLNMSYNDYSNIYISFIQKPVRGFISDINKNPIGIRNLLNISDIIYHNYDNKINNDSFIINFSYGFNYANSINNNLLVNINIIQSNQINLKNAYIFDTLPIQNNIINIQYPTYVIDYSSSYLPIKLQDYYNNLSKYKNLDLISLKLICTNNNYLLFDNQNFYQYFGNLNFNIYYNNYISSNQLLINYYDKKNKNIDYQFLNYYTNNNFKGKATISFDISPIVQFPYPNIDYIYNFNLSFYKNSILLKKYNYNNSTINLSLNIFNKITNIIDDISLKDTNNIRLEYYLSSNTINNNNLNNYLTELYFRNFLIIYDNNSINDSNTSLAIGNDINITGINNIAIGSNITIVGENSLIIGNENSKNPINESIIIGKKNFVNNYVNKSIIIGSNNSTSLINSNQIIIGNNINNKYLLNIDNVICKDEEKLFLGLGSIPIAIGYDSNDNIDINDNSSLYIKNGINASSYNFTNNNNYNITLKANENLTSNITYTLPDLPSNFSRLMLTTDINGTMKWSETNTFDIDTNLILNNIITKSLTVNSYISGDGRKISNINISDKTTDDLREGTSNLYYTSDRTSKIILSNINIIDTDYLKEGKSNLYYTPERDSNSFFSNINKISTDNIKEGSNNLYFNQNYLSNAVLYTFNNYSTDNLKEGSKNFYITQSRVDSFIKNRTTDDFIEGSNNRFFTSQLANSRLAIYFNNITTDNLKEGSSNLYFTNNRVLSNVNRILATKTSDDIKQGTINLYYNQSNVNNIFSNIIFNRNTNDIREGTSNLYLTIPRFNQYLSLRTTDNIKEGSSNFYLTNNKILSIVSNLNTDLIKEGTCNLYYKESYGSNFFFKSINLITTDLIKEGNSNKFIINNTYNSNLVIAGNVKASNIIINNNNLMDIYNQSIDNLRSNYAKTYIKYNINSNVSIYNNSNAPLTLNFNVLSNKPISFGKAGPPFIIVGSNVGINLINPSYNLHVNGYAFANYFIGDGYNISNLNVNYMSFNSDDVRIGNSNRFIVNNLYNNNLTIEGDLIYNNSIIKGDIIPFIDNYYNLGNSVSYLNQIYSKKINLNTNSYIYENNSNQITLRSLNGIVIEDNNSNLNISFKNNKLIFNSNQIFNYDLLYNSPINYSNNYSITKIEKPLIIETSNTNPFSIKSNNNTIFIIGSNNYDVNINGSLNSSDIFIKGINIFNKIDTNSNTILSNINQTSNILYNNLIQTSSNLFNNYINDSNNSNYLSSNLNNTSNYLFNDYSSLINITSFLFYSNLNTTSNILFNNYSSLIFNNFLNLSTNIIQTSNTIFLNYSNLNSNTSNTTFINYSTLDSNTSNITFINYSNLNRTTSNTLFNNINQTSNTTFINYSTLDSNTSNTLFNNINQTSNTTFINYSTLDSNTSNITFINYSNLNRTTSNTLFNNINQTSNTTFINYSTLDSNTSNTLFNNINQTSNTTFINYSTLDSNTSNITFINYSNLNRTTSNTLFNNINQTSNTTFINYSNLNRTTSNTLFNNINQTSNTTFINYSNLNSNTSNTTFINYSNLNRTTSNTTFINYSNLNRTTSNTLFNNINQTSNTTFINYSNLNRITSNSLITNTNITSNNIISSITSRINIINTDTIPLGTSNRFITNNSFNGNLTVSGRIISSNLTTSNINIIGSFTTINTSNYATENLEIVNDSTATSLVVRQLSDIKNLAEFYSLNNLTFVITSNANIGIGIINPNPFYKLFVNGNLNANNYYSNGVDINTKINNNILIYSNILYYDYNQLNSNSSNNNNISSNSLFNNITQTSNSLLNNNNISSNSLFNNIIQSSNNNNISSNSLFSNIIQSSNNNNISSNSLFSNIIQSSNNLLNNNNISSNSLFSNITQTSNNLINNNNISSNSLFSNITQTSNNLLNNNNISSNSLFSNITQTSNNLINYVNSNLSNTSISSNDIYKINSNNNISSNSLFSNITQTSNSLLNNNNISSNSLFSNINITSNNLINYVNSNLSNTSIDSNDIYKINSNIIQSSNNLLNYLNTDIIKEGFSNRFIINDKYERDITFNNIEVKESINCSSLYINNVNINTIIAGTSNLTFDLSNVSNIDGLITNKISKLNTDIINSGNSNRFITNDSYNRDINFNNVIINSNLIVKNNNNYSFTIDSNGNVGIGIDIDNINDNYKLDVDGIINCNDININNESILTIFSSNINVTSNYLFNYSKTNHTYGYNSTVIDFVSIISSNFYNVNSSNYTSTHTCSYRKHLFDSELLIQAEFPYKINGYGSDHYSSRLSIISDIVIEPEYSLEYEQIFIGYAAGGGTRSTTLSPITHKTSIAGDVIYITLELKNVDSDDGITTNNCIFIITEKKPTSKLILTPYITEQDVLRLTSNIYVNNNQLSSNLSLYQTNDYGKWTSNTTTKSIFYEYGYVGIGTNNPNYNLDINGNINCSGIYVNNNNIISSFDNSLSQTSNYLFNFAATSFSNVRNISTFAYNSTVVDFYSYVSSNNYIVNSSNYTDTHICIYNKKLYDSELLIQVDFPYKIEGHGSDHYSSRLSISSEDIGKGENEEGEEFSLEHEQVFIGYAAGGGTRSTTLSPLTYITSITGNLIKIKVQLRLVDSDDSIITNSCCFVITEKKPTSKLILEKYINSNEVINITSNLYVNPIQLSSILTNYQTNNYGKWISNINTNTINYDFGNVGIGVSNPNYNLDVNGNINCSSIYINHNNIFSIVNSNIYETSNNLINYTNLNFSNTRNYNTFAYNSTVIDFYSYISSNSFTVNSSNFTTTHICTYHKKLYDSELLIQVDFPYIIEGYGSDHYASRLSISSEEIQDANDYSLEHEQVFIGYAAGGGTRSTTLSPITHKTNISGNIITIKLQLKLIDSDDPISTNNCLFVITEKKPTSKLVLEKYINSNEVVSITSDLYINPVQLSSILTNYQTNNYGKWISNINTNTINYDFGNVGIGVSNPNYNLDVNGNINCSEIYINNNNLVTTFNSNIYLTSNILYNYTSENFDKARNFNTFAYNSTIIDFYSYISSNSFIINSSSYISTHTCVYHKKLYDSELLINVEFPYIIDGFGSDHYCSRLSISSEDIPEGIEYSLEHEQVFIGYAAGGGTRSTTLSPIIHTTNISGNIITIKLQLKLIDSDDAIKTNNCIFVITEKKPTSKLVLEKYIDNNEVINITSNLYINPSQLSSILENYQTNNYGKWTSNTNNKAIYYNYGNVGIGMNNPLYNLDVNGDINCTNLYINNCNLITNLIQTSNFLFDYTTTSFNNVRNLSSFAYNSTLIDFYSYISSNSFTVNSSNFTTTHICTYNKKLYDSELLIQVDFPYIIEGYGSDHYASRLSISSEEIVDELEFSLEHEQVFIGYAAGGGTRSTTLSPITHKTSIIGNIITIKVQLKLIDSDDPITTNNCLFIITEKKPTSNLVLQKYITGDDVKDITSSLYINPNQLSNILENYQTNNYGKWTSNITSSYINYEIGNVGIGKSTENSLYKLNIDGNLNCDDIYINNTRLLNTIDNNIQISSNSLYEYTNYYFDKTRNFNTFAYNSTIIDFTSIISSNSFTINSSSYISTHTCVYHKKLYDSELLIQADFPYIINGFGSDHYSSRLCISSEENEIQNEYSLEHEQIFIGYAAGGGTRSTTLSPITHTTSIIGNIITIKVEIKLIDSDDSLTTNNCIFVITEKKPSSKLVLTKYIDHDEVINITSNLYINPNQLSSILENYETNNYGKWNCNSSSIYFTEGNVGIGTNNPRVKLHVYGNIVSTGYISSAYSDIRLKTITSTITNALDTITNINGFKYKHNNIAKNYGYTDDNEHIGISAQEISNYIPEVVSLAPFDLDRNDKGDIISKSGENYLTVDYEKIIPYLIESIKELKKENDRLNNRIKKLENIVL